MRSLSLSFSSSYMHKRDSVDRNTYNAISTFLDVAQPADIYFLYLRVPRDTRYTRCMRN